MNCTRISVYQRDGTWVDDVNLSTANPQAATTQEPGGFGSFSFTVYIEVWKTWLLRGAQRVVIWDGFRPIWEGQIIADSKLGDGGGAQITLQCVGGIIELDRATIRRFYMDRRTDVWGYAGTVQPDATSFEVDTADARLRVSAKSGGAFVGGENYALRYREPESDTCKFIAGTVSFNPANQDWRFGFYDPTNAQWLAGLNWTTAQAGVAFATALGTPVGTVDLRLESGGTQVAMPTFAWMMTYLEIPWATAWTDWTPFARESSSDISGGAYVGSLPGTVDGGTAKLVIGGEFPFENVHIPVGRYRNEQASVLIAHYYNGSTLGTLVFQDGTKEGGTTLAHAGDLTFDRPGDWTEQTLNGRTGYFLHLTWSHRIYSGTVHPRRANWHDDNQTRTGENPWGNNDLADTLDGDQGTYNTIHDDENVEGFVVASDYMLFGFTDRWSGWMADIKTGNGEAVALASVYVYDEGDHGNDGDVSRAFLSPLLLDGTNVSGKSMTSTGIIHIYGDYRWRAGKVDGYRDIFYAKIEWALNDWTDSVEIYDFYAIPDIGLGAITISPLKDNLLGGEIRNLLMSYFAGTPVYPQDIILDAVTTKCSLISTDTSLVEDHPVEITEFVCDPYERVVDVVNRLAVIPDTDGYTWAVNVWGGIETSSDGLPRLQFYPMGAGDVSLVVRPETAQSWQDETVEDAIVNSVQVEYTDENGVPQFVYPAIETSLEDADSVLRYGRRQRTIQVGEIGYDNAVLVGSAYVQQWKDGQRRVTCSYAGRVPGIYGSERKASDIRSGDLLAVGGDKSGDQLRIVTTTYTPATDTVYFATSIPEDSLQNILARLLRGTRDNDARPSRGPNAR